MDIDVTVRLSDIIVIVSCISSIVWIKMTVTRHDAVLFNKNGETRVVSFEALARTQASCKAGIMQEAAHQNDDVKKLAKEISELSTKIEGLSRCVTILASGGNVSDC